MENITYSLIVPVYENEETIKDTLIQVSEISEKLKNTLEVVFVVDGGKDRSFLLLQDALDNLQIPCQLIVHSKNFGSMHSVRSGLQEAVGKYFCIMAADLQEPKELIISIFQSLELNECDVALGLRESRNDPFFSKCFAILFWWIYKKFIMKDMPRGGVDIFGCNFKFRNQLLKFQESRSSLISLIFWLGYKRKFLPYNRLKRKEGKSQWSFKKKIDYMLDSVFSFTDYPIAIIRNIGLIGCIISLVLSFFVVKGYLNGEIPVRGYATNILMVLFFGSLNIFGIGLVGTYAWRAYENTKNRPLSIIDQIYKKNYKTNDEKKIIK